MKSAEREQGRHGAPTGSVPLGRVLTEGFLSQEGPAGPWARGTEDRVTSTRTRQERSVRGRHAPPGGSGVRGRPTSPGCSSPPPCRCLVVSGALADLLTVAALTGVRWGLVWLSRASLMIRDTGHRSTRPPASCMSSGGSLFRLRFSCLSVHPPALFRETAQGPTTDTVLFRVPETIDLLSDRWVFIRITNPPAS